MSHFSTEQIAQALGVTSQTVRRWIRGGYLRADVIKVGRRSTYRVREKDYQTFRRQFVQRAEAGERE
jgi:excisionase family DNA binding protein